ncbi:MAG: DUF4402 domain-containing protein [Alphaproteobacteria bacterium]|nr:DUF4402 domain-containing protein [Alphaproteobacteria bacterium]
MRKYFLLSAAALMISSTANATTDYAEVTAKATIQVANTVSCGELDWGTIVIKDGNEEITIDVDYDGYMSYDSDNIISISGNGYTTCTGYTEVGSGGIDLESNAIYLSATGTNKKLTFTPTIDGTGNSSGLGGKLTIPADVDSGEYSATFTLNFVVS